VVKVRLEGKFEINCDPGAAWKFISDPQQIAQCLPDLQRLDVRDNTHFTVLVRVGMAFIRGTFKFDFTLLDQTAPTHSKFEAIGKGAGVSIRLQATIDLKETKHATTELSWNSDVALGDLLGEVSPSLIQGGAHNFTREFFSCIKSELESQAVA